MAGLFSKANRAWIQYGLAANDKAPLEWRSAEHGTAASRAAALCFVSGKTTSPPKQSCPVGRSFRGPRSDACKASVPGWLRLQ